MRIFPSCLLPCARAWGRDLDLPCGLKELLGRTRHCLSPCAALEETDLAAGSVDCVAWAEHGFGAKPFICLAGAWKRLALRWKPSLCCLGRNEHGALPRSESFVAFALRGLRKRRYLAPESIGHIHCLFLYYFALHWSLGRDFDLHFAARATLRPFSVAETFVLRESTAIPGG
jgi:hypothetical protein